MIKQKKRDLLFIRDHKLRDGYYTGQYYLKTNKEDDE